VLEAISGLVAFGLLALCAVVGVRLLRLARRDGSAPVRCLGLYFLLYGTLATGLSISTYLGWSSADLQLPDLATRALNAGFYASATIGLAFLLLFTRLTFRPASPAARSVVLGLVMLMAVSATLVGATEGFAVRVVPGPAYWVHFLARLACWCWVAAESLGYWSKQRRRLALGLADPVVTNRFLLWGVWAVLIALLSLSDPAARLWYVSVAGSTTEWVPEIGRPIIQVTVPVTCALNAATLVLMLLTFFPSPAYRRWIAGRHEAAAARA
jgi:hypothetical protein